MDTTYLISRRGYYFAVKAPVNPDKLINATICKDLADLYVKAADVAGVHINETFGNEIMIKQDKSAPHGLAESDDHAGHFYMIDLDPFDEGEAMTIEQYINDYEL